METGATDGLFLRNAGMPVYGVTGIAYDTEPDPDGGGRRVRRGARLISSFNDDITRRAHCSGDSRGEARRARP